MIGKGVHITIMCTVDWKVTDNLRANMYEGLYTGMVLIDLQKAFDTVDYTILSTT